MAGLIISTLCHDFIRDPDQDPQTKVDVFLRLAFELLPCFPLKWKYRGIRFMRLSGLITFLDSSQVLWRWFWHNTVAYSYVSNPQKLPEDKNDNSKIYQAKWA